MAVQSLSSCVPFLLVLLSSSPSLAMSSSSSRSHHDELETLRPSRRIQQDSTSQQYLVPHNQLRASLGLAPLRWSAALAKYAASWANQRRGDCALNHSSTDYGENIFWGGGSKWQPADAVGKWAAERKYYDYGSNSCHAGQDCSHYTQMVWRKSTDLGCARVVCNSGDTFITCNYNPHGNVIGQKPF